MKKLIIVLAVCWVSAKNGYSIDPPKFKLGAGGGINFSNIADKNSYPQVDDISGDQYSSEYSGLLSNFGHQFFIHGECVFNDFSLALKPGLYTFKFSKSDEVSSNSGTSVDESSYLLRYINTPLEAKYSFGMGNNRPYIGWEFSYGYLIQYQSGSVNSFRSSRLSTGPVFGYFFKFQGFNLVFSSGYDMSLNKISVDESSVPRPMNIKHHNLHFSLSILFNLEKSDFRKSLECPKIQRL